MYSWKTVDWELCKLPYPFKVCFNGIKVSLLEYDEPEGRYIAFETFTKEGANKSTSKSIYILHLSELDKYKYGRSNEVELHIEEISVSRIHGEVFLINNKVMMRDLRSKFGTQVLSKSSNTLDKIDGSQNIFQIGRTWIMISYQKVQKTSWCFSWLWGKSKNVEEEKEIELEHSEFHFLNNKLIIELENNIENLQKDRDSVFNLDESFYNRLVNINLNKDDNQEPKHTSIFGQGYETIDDDKRDVSKVDNSDNSESNFSSNEDNSKISYSNSISGESSFGIGVRNRRNSLISQEQWIVIKKPM